MSEVEGHLRESLRQLGAQALGELLEREPGTPAAELDCEWGGTLGYQRRRKASVLSVFGRVVYERAYYAGCACGHEKAPLDET